MNPIFRIERIDVVLHPLDMVSVVVDQLGERVGSLEEHGQAIGDALDELFARSWVDRRAIVASRREAHVVSNST